MSATPQMKISLLLKNKNVLYSCFSSCNVVYLRITPNLDVKSANLISIIHVDEYQILELLHINLKMIQFSRTKTSLVS